MRATVLFPIDQHISSPVWGQLYADAVRLLIWVLPVWIYLKLVDKTEPATYLRLNTFGDTGQLLRSSLIVGLYFVIILYIDFARAGFPAQVVFSPFLLSNSWVKTILVISVSPLAEEILFRGFFLRKLEVELEQWQANLWTSILFVSTHMPNWLYTGKSSPEILILAVGVFAVSLLLGYVVQSTQSLWPGIIVHMLNNVIAFYVRFG